MSGDGLARRDPFAVASLSEAFTLAETLAKARGFVPDAYVNQPAAIMAAILTGHELGLPPMTSLREIHVIKGKPTLSATLMLMLVHRAGISSRWLVSDDKKAVIGLTRPGCEEQSMGFSIEEARAAGLAGQGTWKTYPAAMLRARATSSAIKAFCPEVIGGSTYESESGEITDGEPSRMTIESRAVEEPTPLTGRIDQPAETPPSNGHRTRLDECADDEQRREWCIGQRERIAKATPERQAEAVERVYQACGGRVSRGAIRSWLGLPTTTDESGETVPPQD